MLDLLKSFPSFLTNTTGGERMTKVRVHEYAKLVKKTSKEVIEELGKLNVNVTNHMSTIDKDVVSKLDKSFGGNKESKETSKAPASSKPDGQNRPAGSGQNQRPATGGQSRPAGGGQNQRPAPGGQNRPASGGQNRPASGWTKSSSIRRTESSSIRRTESSSIGRTESSSIGRTESSSIRWTKSSSSGGQNYVQLQQQQVGRQVHLHVRRRAERQVVAVDVHQHVV